jgi:biopolymer transport protein ExbB/TolQ
LIFSKKEVPNKLIEAVKHIGVFAAVWGTLFTMYGLLNAFDAIEGASEEIPMPVIMGGLKVALLTIIYGLVICTISLFAYIILKLGGKKSNI